MTCIYDKVDEFGNKASYRLFAVTRRNGSTYYEHRTRITASDGRLVAEAIFPAEWVDCVTEDDYKRAIPRKSKA